jgi:cytochrome c oxidase assembly factor CtaG
MTSRRGHHRVWVQGIGSKVAGTGALIACFLLAASLCFGAPENPSLPHLFCWLVVTVALIGWHVPSAFDLALRSDAWHEAEHACFFTTSLLFWWPVVLPFPSATRWPRWSIPLYLFLGTLPGGALGAFLVFLDRVLYPSYAAAPRLFGLSPLEDQVVAGAFMWLLGMFAYLIPAILIAIQLMSPLETDHLRRTRVALPGIPEDRCDSSKVVPGV